MTSELQTQLDREVEEYNEISQNILKVEEEIRVAKEQLAERRGRITLLDEQLNELKEDADGDPSEEEPS